MFLHIELFLFVNDNILNKQELIFGPRLRFSLTWFNGISTTVGYLIPSPFLYI